MRSARPSSPAPPPTALREIACTLTPRHPSTLAEHRRYPSSLPRQCDGADDRDEEEDRGQLEREKVGSEEDAGDRFRLAEAGWQVRRRGRCRAADHEGEEGDQRNAAGGGGDDQERGRQRAGLGLEVEEHDDEEEEDDDRAGVDDDLEDGDERGVEAGEQDGEEEERRDEGAGAVDGVPVNDDRERRDYRQERQDDEDG